MSSKLKNEIEKKILFFLAYHGQDEKLANGEQFCNTCQISQEEYFLAINNLKEKELINLDYLVKEEYYIQILKELYNSNASWCQEFKTIYQFSRTSIAEYLCNITKLILKKEYQKAAKLYRPYQGIGEKQINLIRYFIKNQEEEDLKIFQYIPEEEFFAMAKDFLEDSFYCNNLKEEDILFLNKLLENKKTKFLEEIIDQINGYSFLIFGKKTNQTNKKTFWNFAIKAISFLYQDNLEESIENFEQALKLSGKNKKSFSNPILNYALGIALYRISKKGENKYQENLKEFLLDKNIRFKDSNYCIRGILETLEGNNDFLENNFVSISPNNKVENSLAFILNNFLEKESQNIPKENLHSSAILIHEMANFLNLENQQKENYTNLFFGKALINTIRKKTKWEIAFGEIEQSVNNFCKEEKRIAYYVSGYNLDAIVEQTKKGENWQDGQVLSLSKMINEGYDIMDEKDSMIANSLKDNCNYENAAKVIIPILKDSNRIYFGSFFEGIRAKVEIYKENPYLQFTPNGENILVTSNVNFLPSGDIAKHYLTHLKIGLYKLISLNPIQKDVIKKFLSLEKIPLSAAISLKKAIESLNGIIDVRDNLLTSIKESSIVSKGTIAVRIVPEKNEFRITILAIGIENGKERFIPNQGSQTVYDEVDNQTISINRNLKKEEENYLFIKDFVENTLYLELESYSEFTIFSAEKLLNLLAFVWDNNQIFFVEWPMGKALKFRGDIKNENISIEVKSESKWFTIEGKANSKTAHLELDQLIKACCDSQFENFVKISENQYVRMSKELKRHIAAINSLCIEKDKKRIVPKFQVGAFSTLLNNLNYKEDGGYSAFLKLTKEAYQINPEIPKELNAKLRDYQEEGFRWICRLSAWGAGACLADDMGLGKTIQAIAFLIYKSKEGPSLVIAPKSVLPNWESEIARFAPSLKCININSQKNRLEIINSAKENDIILCSYTILSLEESSITPKNWNVICLDEAHSIKNRNTISSRVAMDLNGKSRLILTGTPIQNNIGELWNLFQFINPGLLGSWSVFRDSFMIGGLDNEHKDLLKEMTMPFILHRSKDDVLKELPEKIISQKIIELSENEHKVYEQMRQNAELKFKKYKDKLERSEAKKLDIKFFKELMKLRQAACSMKLINHFWKEKSSKIIAFMEILENIISNPNNNILVFSQFTSFLELIKVELNEKQIEYLYLDGQTPLEKRKEYVEEFQEGKKRLFLSSLKAGGFGINLTKANYVILLDPWWNPSVENQAMDRAHRIGQKRVVTVIRLISGQTIEEKIINLHQEKQMLSEDILLGTQESSKLSYEDVLDMVCPF